MTTPIVRRLAVAACLLLAHAAHAQCGGGSGECCTPGGNGTPGCDDAACCDTVCTADPFCCETEWDALCTLEACDMCASCNCALDECGASFAGDCYVANGTPACSNLCDGAPCGTCCDTICAADAFCCDSSWDTACAEMAVAMCDPGATCEGDSDFDGTVSVADLVNVITLWGTDGQGPGVDADIDGDGTVAVPDLVLVITNWGECV